jgi:hypothetical protein
MVRSPKMAKKFLGTKVVGEGPKETLLEGFFDWTSGSIDMLGQSPKKVN